MRRTTGAVCTILGALTQLVLASCGDDEGAPGDAGGSGYLQIDEWSGGGPPVVTVLLVVDGSDDDHAAALRQTLATWVKDSGWYPASCAAVDPVGGALFREIRTVVVFSGSDGAAEYVTSAQEPALRLQASEVQGAGLAAWQDAVAGSLLSYVPNGRGGAQLLRTYRDTSDLLWGTLAPITSVEADVVVEGQGTQAVNAYIATAHDDASSDSVESYVPDLEDMANLAAVGWLIAPDDGSASCAAVAPGRLADFALASYIDTYPWISGGDCSLPAAPHSCGQSRCTEKAVPLNSDGSTACRVFFATSDDEGCPTQSGWRELDDGPLSLEVTAAWPDANVCELVQLRGTALAVCQSDLDCAGCEPGFCFTAVPELTSLCAAESELATAIPRIITQERAGMYSLYCPAQ